MEKASRRDAGATNFTENAVGPQRTESLYRVSELQSGFGVRLRHQSQESIRFVNAFLRNRWTTQSR